VDAGKRVVLAIAAQESALSVPTVTPVSPAEISERLAWRVPRLRFSGTPLTEAIPMFNRHSRVQLVCGDSEVGKLKLSGALRADDIESLVQLLGAEFGIKTESTDQQQIILRR
jgi:transmembrane sensor